MPETAAQICTISVGRKIEAILLVNKAKKKKPTVCIPNSCPDKIVSYAPVLTEDFLCSREIIFGP